MSRYLVDKFLFTVDRDPELVELGRVHGSPLADLADFCQARHLWLHVDGAHGGSALLSARHTGTNVMDIVVAIRA